MSRVSNPSFKVSTVERYQRFSECALPLATRVAKKALLQLGVGPSAIGKMVLVTSTGVTTGVSYPAYVVGHGGGAMSSRCVCAFYIHDHENVQDVVHSHR